MTAAGPAPILMVDDRPENLTALAALLGDLELALVTAQSGNEALRLSLKTEFALVLLDVQMPGMDGFETAELLRANPKTRRTPIIFVTAGMKDDHYRFKGYDAGAVDYLTKPIEPQALRSKVRVFCELFLQRKELERHEQLLETLVEQRTIALRESEASYRAILESASDYVSRYDRQGAHLFANAKALALTGHTLEQYRGKTHRELGFPDHLCGLLETAIARVVVTGEPTTKSFDLQSPAGPAYLELKLSPEKDILGQVRSVVGMARDLTERHQLEGVRQFLAQASWVVSEEPFFQSLARYLASTLEMDYVCIDRLEGEAKTARTLAIFTDGHFEPNVSYGLQDTPCGDVVKKGVCCFPHGVRHRFPADAVLQDMLAESYVGTTLWNSGGEAIGLIAVIGKRPLANPALAEKILALVAIRAAGELERKLAEEALQKSEAKFRSLAESSPDYIMRYDRQGRHTYMNPAGFKVSGMTAADVIGKTHREAGFPEDLCRLWEEQILHVFDTAIPTQLEFEWTGIHGSRMLDTRLTPEFDAEDQVISVLGVSRDVTERRNAEQARLANLKFFECMDRVNRALQHAQDLDSAMSEVLETMLAIFATDRAWLVYPCDPEAASFRVPMERTRPEFPGAQAAGLEIPMDRDTAKVLQALRAASGPVTFGPGADQPLVGAVSERFQERSQIAMALFPKTGEPWVLGMHQCSHPRIWTQEERTLFQEIGRRLSDALTSLLVYRDLCESQDFLNSIVELIPNMIFVKDAKTLRLVRLNKFGEQLLGYSKEELLAKDSQAFSLQEEAGFSTAKDHEVFATNGIVDIPEETIQTRDKGERILHTKKLPILDKSGQPKYLLGIAEDITERRQAEEERRKLDVRMSQVQKLEALGVLVAGVAHNMNNVLAAIMATASLRENLATEIRDLEAYRIIGTACRRGRDVVKSLMHFAQPTLASKLPLELHALITEVRVLLENTTRNRIDIIEDFAGEPLWTLGDAGSLSHALMNLCLNSLDAMPDGGTLTLRTAVPEKDWIEVFVEDSGEGMTPEVLVRVTEPFFTTKDVGKGTGLGLSMTHGVIKAHGGTLEIASAPGKSTSVKIRIPRIPVPALGPTVQALSLPLGPLSVLLVDDDEDVRYLVSRMLKNAGLQIATVAGGEEALESLQAGAIPDLIILDQNMPRMNGIQTMERIRVLFPHIPILISSGQPDIEEWACFKQPYVAVLAKPFGLTELLAKVAQFALHS